MQTEAFSRFHKRRGDLIDLINFAWLFAGVDPIPTEELANLLPSASATYFTNAKLQADKPRFERLCMEILLCRSFDELNGYLYDVLTSLFQARPHLALTGKKIDAMEVIDCGSIEGFVEQMAIDKADQVTYGKGVSGMLTALVDELGLNATFDPADLTLVSYSYAVRNTLVHTRGRVNKKFLRDTGRTDIRVGEMLSWTRAEDEAWRRALRRIIRIFDNAIIAQYGPDVFQLVEVE